MKRWFRWLLRSLSTNSRPYSPFEDSLVKVKVLFMQDIAIAQTPEPIPPLKGVRGMLSLRYRFLLC